MCISHTPALLWCHHSPLSLWRSWGDHPQMTSATFLGFGPSHPVCSNFKKPIVNVNPQNRKVFNYPPALIVDVIYGGSLMCPARMDTTLESMRWQQGGMEDGWRDGRWRWRLKRPNGKWKRNKNFVWAPFALSLSHSFLFFDLDLASGKKERADHVYPWIFFICCHVGIIPVMIPDGISRILY